MSCCAPSWQTELAPAALFPIQFTVCATWPCYVLYLSDAARSTLGQSDHFEFCIVTPPEAFMGTAVILARGQHAYNDRQRAGIHIPVRGQWVVIHAFKPRCVSNSANFLARCSTDFMKASPQLVVNWHTIQYSSVRAVDDWGYLQLWHRFLE